MMHGNRNIKLIEEWTELYRQMRRNFAMCYSGEKVKGAVMDWAYRSLNTVVTQSKYCPLELTLRLS